MHFRKKNNSSFLYISIIAQAVSFLSIFIFNKFFIFKLNLGNFSTLITLTILATNLESLITFGIGNTLIRFSSSYKPKKNLLFTGLILLFFIVIFSYLGTILLFLIFNLKIINIDNYFNLITIIFGIVFFRILLYAYKSWSLGNREKIELLIAHPIPKVFELILSFLFVFLFNTKIITILLGILLANFVFVIINLVRYGIKNGLGKYDKKCLKLFFTISGPNSIYILSWRLLEMLITINLFNNFSEEIVSMYGIALSMIGTIRLISTPINLTISSLVYENFDKNMHVELRGFLKEFSYLYLIFLILMGVSFYTFTPLLVLIISSIDFLGVIDIIPMMLVGILLDSYSITLSWPYFFKKEVKAESIRSIFATSISIILLFFLIPAFGIIGAATIYLINQALRMIFIYKKSQKFYQYDFLLLKKISMIFLILLIEIILYLIFSFLSNNFVIISSLISLIIIIIIIFNFRKSLINITKNVSHFINSSHFS